MKIFISCGHNNAFIAWYSRYRDQGATNTSFGNTMTEYQFSKKIAGEIQRKFPAEEWTQYVFVPEWLNLQARIAWINKNAVDGDMCIELHMDSASPQAEWCSTWYMSGSKWAEDKARIFQQEYTRVTWVRWRWVHGDLSNRLGRLAFVRDTKCLAYLLEMGFISNSGDRDKVWTKAAEGIAKWLALITPLK